MAFAEREKSIKRGERAVSKQTKTLIKLIVLGVLIVLSIIPVIAFGWFSNSNRITAIGAGVTVKSTGLEIRAEKDGEDISVLEPSKEMSCINNVIDGEEDKIRPSSTGYFEFYVYNPNEEGYSFSFDITVKNNEFATNEGFKNVSDEGQRAKALKYINSHVMTFTDLKDGKYSGYIPPNGSVKRSVETGGESERVVVYWVWVAYYDEIFTDKKDLIDEETRKEIAEYYSANENAESMFEGEADENGYNQADCIIGTTLRRICFAVDVREE